MPYGELPLKSGRTRCPSTTPASSCSAASSRCNRPRRGRASGAEPNQRWRTVRPADDAELAGLDDNDPNSVARLRNRIAQNMGKNAGGDFEQAMEELARGSTGEGKGARENTADSALAQRRVSRLSLPAPSQHREHNAAKHGDIPDPESERPFDQFGPHLVHLLAQRSRSGVQLLAQRSRSGVQLLA